jgi:hypothetical protein
MVADRNSPLPKVLAPIFGIHAPIAFAPSVFLAMLQNLHQIRITAQPVILEYPCSDQISRMGKRSDDCPFLFRPFWPIEGQ